MQSATIGDMKAEMLLDFMEEVESVWYWGAYAD